MLLSSASGETLGAFTFDLAREAGRAFVLLSLEFVGARARQVIVYGIDGTGRCIMPLELTANPQLTIGDPVGEVRVGRVAEAARSDTSAVPGIGPAFAARLTEAGLRATGQIATLDPARSSASGRIVPT